MVLVLLGTILYFMFGAIRLRSIDDELIQRSINMPGRPGFGGGFAFRGGPGQSNDPGDLTDPIEGFDDGGGPPIFGTVRGDDPPNTGPPPFIISQEGAAEEGVDPELTRRIQVQYRLLFPRTLDINGKDQIRPEMDPFIAGDAKQAWSGDLVFGETTVEGLRVRVLTRALKLDGRTVGVLQMGAPMDTIEREQSGLLRVLLLMLPVALATTGAVGFFLARRALSPMGDMADSMARIEVSGLSQRLPVAGNDEFANLSTRFNGLLARLEDSFEQQRQFVADASHELKSPLTVIKTRADLALRADRSPEQYREHLEAIARSAQSMNRIVADLLLLAQADENRLELRCEDLVLEELLRDAAAALPLESQGKIQLEVSHEVKVRGDRSMLTRLFRNLFENADRHTDQNGLISASVVNHGSGVKIVVRDNGTGIAPEHLLHIFDRFYRVDSARDRDHGGTGLGLPISKSIAEAHGGNLVVESKVDEGTVVTVSLPSKD